ncbi:hypothetical protein PQX77_007240 [Marasmius sp. AFHP31]|nr:hypothetical protein PQX77_007240 [Marasmius sp. AFHP31]
MYMKLVPFSVKRRREPEACSASRHVTAGGSVVTVATSSAAEVASAPTSAASGVRKTVTMTASAAARPTNGAEGLHASSLLAAFMLAVSLIARTLSS